MKKRKLNSKNPKYVKVEERQVRKEFINEVKGVKIYKVYNLT